MYHLLRNTNNIDYTITVLLLNIYHLDRTYINHLLALLETYIRDVEEDETLKSQGHSSLLCRHKNQITTL